MVLTSACLRFFWRRTRPNRSCWSIKHSSAIVSPAERSPKAKSKDLLKRTEDGPVHSFQTLMKDLAPLTRNEVRVGEQTVQMLATPTPVQQRALQLLQVSVAV